MKYLYSEITEKIIEASYKVYNALGFGFLEKVYENALSYEIGNSGLQVDQQKPLIVYYDRKIVGEYYADLLVEGKVIIEVKSVKKLIDIHEIQLLNYLKGINLKVGLLINFNESVEVIRKFRS
jgi:GxxExxY protein